jgi:hypothetical protein
MSDRTVTLSGLEGNRIEMIFHDHDDEGWVSASLAVRAGHFAGSFHAAFHTHDLLALHETFQKLQQRFDGRTEFATVEPWVSLSISGDRHGHLRARCVVRDRLGDGAELAFPLSFDQSYLPDLLKQTAYVLTRFHPKGSSSKDLE